MASSSRAKLAWDFILAFLSISTIHGFNHLAAIKRHPLEIILWAFFVAVGMYGASILSGLTLVRYQENPTVISMERDRFSWNTSFPSATICPTSKLNQALLEVYLEKSTSKNKTALRKFLTTLANATYSNFEDVTFYDDISPDDYMSLLVDLQFDFKPSVSNSGVNGKQYTIQSAITEMGICYSFNSQLAKYNAANYWEKNLWIVYPENETFYVNPLDGEVFANVVNMSTGFKIFLHGPSEVADVASKNIESPNGFFLQVYISALSIYSSERARALNPKQRKCRFYDESNLRHSPVYSYVLCRMECRSNLGKQLCGCIPHFYRKLGGDKTCDVKGLHCLSKHKDRLITMKRECKCYPNCDDVNYVIENFESREWFLGSNLQWGLKEYPRMRLKRDVIFGFTDVLVYIGGMAGLFFGCSVLSFIEILYFFTLRLFWFIKNYKKVRQDYDKK
ncbi:PREDICTED: pickpocket protein 28-like [Nicrophorus vespilloides]|uniref:Pickpocket protein 28-like n=1 Tax=Nicrophorus vespilloides TaxID=110193 RepID=A0ABM1NI07_NICVS|nr:PREDICTED: pickpocket protein 28-like [Nicrophorus vespilloides]